MFYAISVLKRRKYNVTSFIQLIDINMNRIVYYLMVLALVMPISVTASELLVQRFEGEIFGGLTLPLESYHRSNTQISGAFGIEGRYNFPNTKWDCGLMIALSTDMDIIISIAITMTGGKLIAPFHLPL